MRLHKIRKIWFAVVLTIIFVFQETSLPETDHFGRDVSFFRHRADRYSFQEETVKAEVPETGDSFRIRYELNGGSTAEENPRDYSQKDLPLLFDIPQKQGYNFAGWYTDSELTQKVERLSGDVSKAYCLYAKWTKCIDSGDNVRTYPYETADASDEAYKKLKDCQYAFWEACKIPGMPATREEDFLKKKIMDTNQCPQGICMTGEYLLISSYSGRTDSPGCIHVFDQKTGEYLVTLGIKKDSHLGGLAFDGESVWVCHYENNTLGRLSYSFVKQTASLMPQTMVDCSGLVEEFHVLNEPSCVTYEDGMLWVATHTKFFNSRMFAYQVTEKGLRQLNSCRIPDKVQGIAFDEEKRVYVSASYGRTKSSYLMVYASIDALDEFPGKPLIKIEMPPCSEEIVLDDQKIYVLFESAAEKYLEGTDGKGKSLAPIDKILAVSKESVFP